ncbi:hypothetical protein HXX76_006744 [Chlamydomonas incerta]|uniref:Uncharacterized protein n=1 Tax=Chlamydomonas incerta TaxID=51695 RepID=A0A835T320_CHLIN|nr:hypothetical protein HXX76_006744 [Chlamydomonas incerta]|eukprot:KAG2436441.1 hypothetical protein HXX76_006744 [Chlamydomonas incerta]
MFSGASSELSVPVILDESDCASFNADDYSPILGLDGAVLGYALVRSAGPSTSGAATAGDGAQRLEVSIALNKDSGVAFAQPQIRDDGLGSSSGGDAADQVGNVHAAMSSYLPTSCLPALPPGGEADGLAGSGLSAASSLQSASANCSVSGTRARLAFDVPPGLFNCSAAAANYNGTGDLGSSYYKVFFLSVKVVANQISPGCSYITVTATCRPSTCPGFQGSAASADSGGGSSGVLGGSGRSSGTGGGVTIGGGSRSGESDSLQLKVVLPGIIGGAGAALVLSVIAAVGWVVSERIKRRRRREARLRAKLERASALAATGTAGAGSYVTYPGTGPRRASVTCTSPSVMLRLARTDSGWSDEAEEGDGDGEYEGEGRFVVGYGHVGAAAGGGRGKAGGHSTYTARSPAAAAGAGGVSRVQQLRMGSAAAAAAAATNARTNGRGSSAHWSTAHQFGFPDAARRDGGAGAGVDIGGVHFFRSVTGHAPGGVEGSPSSGFGPAPGPWQGWSPTASVTAASPWRSPGGFEARSYASSLAAGVGDGRWGAAGVAGGMSVTGPSAAGGMHHGTAGRSITVSRSVVIEGRLVDVPVVLPASPPQHAAPGAAAAAAGEVRSPSRARAGRGAAGHFAEAPDLRPGASGIAAGRPRSRGRAPGSSARGADGSPPLSPRGGDDGEMGGTGTLAAAAAAAAASRRAAAGRSRTAAAAAAARSVASALLLGRGKTGVARPPALETIESGNTSSGTGTDAPPSPHPASRRGSTLAPPAPPPKTVTPLVVPPLLQHLVAPHSLSAPSAAVAAAAAALPPAPAALSAAAPPYPAPAHAQAHAARGSLRIASRFADVMAGSAPGAVVVAAGPNTPRTAVTDADRGSPGPASSSGGDREDWASASLPPVSGAMESGGLFHSAEGGCFTVTEAGEDVDETTSRRSEPMPRPSQPPSESGASVVSQPSFFMLLPPTATGSPYPGGASARGATLERTIEGWEEEEAETRTDEDEGRTSSGSRGSSGGHGSPAAQRRGGRGVLTARRLRLELETQPEEREEAREA